ncbi:DUF3467 domain-containing protein [Agromyces sp. Leaf222]|uniref:DUF3467 domain-containing protein n=1 Tax=Agromyces sp. Leaf222 TaxID=1735688 RepID=UPI0006FF5C12|nr:DUF3467 domain-containing protein [Agromyces sp. Leaf222]KQM81455.1 hypothetical protein ASE68_17015 [Agromyces sp. Leaf222]
MSDDHLPRRFQIDLPSDRAQGVFADFARVWHTPNVFVIDYVALTQPPSTVEDPDGTRAVAVPGQVVSRIRIPPEQVFELAKALTQQLEAWEQETGRKPPERPLFGSGHSAP